MIVGAKAACGAVVQFFAQLISVRRINHEFDDVARFQGLQSQSFRPKREMLAPRGLFSCPRSLRSALATRHGRRHAFMGWRAFLPSA
jgi:hypothetical protein